MIIYPEWREKAMFLVVLEGFLAAAPQLVLQLSLWFNGNKIYIYSPCSSIIFGGLRRKSLVLQVKSGASNEKLWGLRWKVWDSNEKLGVFNEKLGLSNESLGFSDENMGFPIKIWGLQWEAWGLQWKSGGFR